MKKHRLATLLFASLLGMLSPASPAATNERDWNLPAGQLTDVLNQLGRESGILLSWDAILTDGKQTPGLSGAYSTRQALRQLLQGTGILAVPAGDGNWRLEAANGLQADTSLLLPSLQIQGEQHQTESLGAATTHHITREQLDRFTPTNAGDIFRDIPGVTAANNRTGASLDLNIRGVQGMGRVKILVDGTNSTSSDYRGYGGTASHVFVDPELLGDVSIEKGPASGPYGAGSTGGVVSLRTLEANDLIQPGNNYGLRLRGTWGNNSSSGSLGGDDGAGNTLPGSNHVASAAGAWKINEQLELVAAITQRKSGNYSVGSRGGQNNRFPVAGGTTPPLGQWFTIADTPKGAVVDNTSQDVLSALIKGRFFLPNDQTLDLGLTTYDNAYGNPRLTMTTEGTPSQHRLSETDKKTYTAKYTWTPAGNRWIDLRANLWGVQSEEYRAGGTWGSSHEQRSITRSRGVEVWNTSRFNWNWLPLLDLRYGATWMREKLDLTELGTANVAGVNPDGQRDIGSLFMEFEAQPLDWLMLHGGLRQDAYNLQGDKSFAASVPGQNDTQVHYDDSKNRLNPSLGVVIRPWGEQARFFARYSEGWRPGTIREVINSYAPGNPSLNLLTPEISKTLEIGTRFSTQGLLNASDRANAGLTLFNTRYDNYVIGGLGTFSNIPGVRYRGLELELDYDIDWLFAQYALTRYLRQQVCHGGTLGCTNGEYYASDIELEGINAPPRYQHSVTLGTRLLERRLVLGLRASIVGDRMLPKLDPDGNRNSRAAWTAGWTAYTVYDLFGSYQLNRQLAASFGVENLRDEYYLEANTPTQLAIPAPGRTAKLTLTYTF